MSADELHELQEHAEHAGHDRSLAPATLTMAILAVAIALVSLLGHRSHTEEVVLQDKITDQWAYYQAKNIRRHTDQVFVDLTSALAAKESEQTAKLEEKYKAEEERYKTDLEEASAEAKKLEEESHVEHRRADRYDLSEAFLEIALVITSITLLSRQKAFWYAGMVLGVGGLVILVTGLLIH
ncbi:MAG TPA: DUF4337 domain-containing protein [Blastocatellia bacterium]|nr:DUF4337 domain-containing protein [Blastocatellia bacterium]